MLVLTRTAEQEIMIGNDIILRIVWIKGDRVRIGIDAPENVAIHRREVWEEIQREKTTEGQR